MKKAILLLACAATFGVSFAWAQNTLENLQAKSLSIRETLFSNNTITLREDGGIYGVSAKLDKFVTANSMSAQVMQTNQIASYNDTGLEIKTVSPYKNANGDVPQGSIETGALAFNHMKLKEGGQSGLKICSYTRGADFRDSMIVPDNWTTESCGHFAFRNGGTFHELICMTDTTFKTSTDGNKTWPAPCSS